MPIHLNMKPISDSFFELFYFFIGNSPDSHPCVPNEHSREDLSSTIVRESAADPSKWLRFFNQIIEHPDIPDELAAPVFDGMVAHLNYRSGRIPVPQGFRQPPSVPSKDRITRFILESLERHSVFLEKGQRVADAVLALSETAAAMENTTALVSYLVRLSAHPDPVPVHQEAPESQDTSPAEFIEDGRRSVRGKAADSAMRIAARLHGQKQSRDPLLTTLLIRFATDPHPGVRSALLHQLGSLAHHDDATAWKLHRSALQSFQDDLWPDGEPFLRMQYATHRRSVLNALRQKNRSVDTDGDAWGRTMTEAYLENEVSPDGWIRDLEYVSLDNAWTAAFDLLDTRLENAPYRDVCKKGLLKLASRPLSMPCLLERLPSFLPDRMTDFIDITVEIAYKFIMHFNGSNRTYDLFWLYRWIEELSEKSPAMADQIRNDLLAAIRRSDRSARIWQADAYAGCLDGMPEKNREHRKQGR